MAEEKRTFESDAQLLPPLKLQARRTKAKKRPTDHLPEVEADELSEHGSLPISQELILRLIKVLKET